ncbi:MAG: hypothetical protein OXP73_09320 [Chloroflexota bacterium]|nr:hypothetical protein [Chloroflexota bacterium]
MTASEGPGYPALRWRGIGALAVTLALIVGLALFVALMREGRTTLGGISAAWALTFAVTVAATAGWSLASVLLVAFVARRRVDDVLAGQVLTHWPLLAPVTLVVMAFVSDAVNHRLLQTDDLRWLWAVPIGVWVAGQVLWLPLSLDGLRLSPIRVVRDAISGLAGSRFARLTFGLIFVQFVALRLGLALLWRPIGLFERGSDVGAYEQRARLALQGLQPYLDYWVEYPPVFPWTASGLKLLSVPLGGDEAAFQVLFSLMMVGFEAGILWLIHAIAVRVWDEPRGLVAAAAYAALFYPIYIANRHFESIAVFFTLLGVHLVIAERRHTASLAIALGVLTKLFPAAVLPALLAGQSWTARTRYLGLAAAAVIGALAPLAVIGREFFVASIQNMLLRPGWETVWALADGYFGFGWIHRYRQSPDTALEFNYTPDLPAAAWWGTAAAVAALYTVLALRRSPPTPASVVWSTGLALAAFALYLRGWSPQFMVWLLPFALLAYPGGRGFLIATGLSVLALLEYPAYFVLWSEHPWVLWLLVVARTLAILALGAVFARRLWRGGRSSPAGPAPATSSAGA